MTVVASTCMEADGLATALMVMGPEKGLAFAKEHALPVFMIIKTDEGFREDFSPAFEPFLKR